MNSVQKNVENNLKKIIRYSEPVSDKETFFIWPESITSGAYYSDLLKYKNIIKRELFRQTFYHTWNKHKVRR